jgi:uncharacterized membrane protein YgcG
MELRRLSAWTLTLSLLTPFAVPCGLHAQQAKPAPAGQPAAGRSTDDLVAPIALYPDALVTQILQASVDVAALQKFTGWLAGQSSLKGSALQDAAQKAGFAACYIALAPFPQVVKMLAEKPDWTQQLGRAYSADKAAVYESVQRLRGKAQAMGNLKTTEQQEVVMETSSAGQQVIVIQPANPEVIYVPVYTQTVYVQPAPPPSAATVTGAALIGFTAGIIIGSSHNHYYGGWRGGAAAWNQREDFYEDRYDDRKDYAEDRQDNAQGNQDQRQSNKQSNQSQRQSSAQANQGQRQGNRQTTGAGAGAGGYQSGSSARAQSSRGSSSRSSSRGGGGRSGGGGRR